MKALPVEKLPEGDWLYEIKFDGYRALAFKDGKEVRLISRNSKEFNYPQLLDALKLLPANHVVLDGEIVALDEKGRSSFQLLQMFKSSEQRVPLANLPKRQQVEHYRLPRRIILLPIEPSGAQRHQSQETADPQDMERKRGRTRHRIPNRKTSQGNPKSFDEPQHE